MKTSFVVASILAALLCTQVATPTSADVGAAINQWAQDVIQVNSYLETAESIISDPTEESTAAGAAAMAAKDEQAQMKIVSAVLEPNAPVILKAVTDASGVIANLVTNLQLLYTAPTPYNVARQVYALNLERCCHELPNLDIIWPAAAVRASAPAPPKAAPRAQP